MTEYFAVIDEDGLRGGPFQTMNEATRFLTQSALDRGYIDEEADQFFHHGSAVVKVEIEDGRAVFFHLGWPPREDSSIQQLAVESREAMPEMVMAKAPPPRNPD
jgi:hypothetical protein